MTSTLTIDSITANYGRLTVLKYVRLTIIGGTCHAIVGPNGAGKSSLLAALAGTLPIASGRVLLDGRTITRATPARRARLGISRTYQTPSLWKDFTALENVELGCSEVPDSPQRTHHPFGRDRDLHALRILDQVGLGNHARTPARQLSHGQRRLLDLAIALAAQPTVLLLDEPTAGLADEDVDRFLTLLHKIRSTLTIVLVEHRLDVVAELADTVTVLVNGGPIATGPLPDVAEDPAVAQYYPMLAVGP